MSTDLPGENSTTALERGDEIGLSGADPRLPLGICPELSQGRARKCLGLKIVKAGTKFAES
jgi:hypothetical protein